MARRKAAAYITEHNIHPCAVPVAHRTSSVTLNQNKTIVAKRNNFPLIPGCTMTIYKAQGGTYDQIVYKKSHSM